MSRSGRTGRGCRAAGTAGAAYTGRGQHDGMARVSHAGQPARGGNLGFTNPASGGDPPRRTPDSGRGRRPVRADATDIVPGLQISIFGWSVRARRCVPPRVCSGEEQTGGARGRSRTFWSQGAALGRRISQACPSPGYCVGIRYAARSWYRYRSAGMAGR